jgi:translation initiation factor 3 subunit J
VKDNWDDEDEPEPSAATPAAAPTASAGGKKKKNLAKIIAAKEEAEAARRPVTAEEILADKLAKEKLQKESDLKLAIESFGLSEMGLDALPLTSRDDFDEFRKSLVDKMRVAEKSSHYVSFLEATFRDLCAALEADDIKRIGSSLVTLSNEKRKAVTNVKKKKKGAAIRVERSDMVYDDDANEFDDFM